METEKNAKRLLVRPHKIAYAVGAFSIVAAVMLGALELTLSVSIIPLWVYLVIGAIFLLGVYVCLEAKNKRLLVEDDVLYYSNFLGHMKKFFLKDIGYVRVAADSAKGQDCFKIYDKEGHLLCRLEWSMKNAEDLLNFFYDSDILIETDGMKADKLPDFMTGKMICRENIAQLSAEVLFRTKEAVMEWKKRNERLGADFYYGFVCFRGGCMDENAELQSKESCCEVKAGEELPADFLCMMELFVKKGGFFIRDRRGNLLVMDFPVFYKRSTRAIGEDIRLYYNESCIGEIKDALSALEKYLPGHRFYEEKIELEYELGKEPLL